MKKIDWRSLLKDQTGAVLMILCGAVLAISPDSASVLLSGAAGWLLIAAGVALLIIGFVGGVQMGAIIPGAVLLMAGAWLHRHPMMIASVLGLILGIVAFRQGWQGAKESRRVKRSGGFWIPGAVLSVLELIVGVRLIFSPLSASRWVLTIAGILMVLCGAADLAAHYRGRKYIRGDSRIIDADE